MPADPATRWSALLLLPVLLLAGCAGQGPSGFAAPTWATAADEVVRHYDLDADDQPEMTLRQARIDAQVAAVEFADGPVAHPPAGPVPHLLIILDSIPFDVVRVAQRSGWFPLFPPPSRLVSPFPVMTDVALADLYDMFPLPGVESLFLDGDQLSDPTETYLASVNMPWTARMDYSMEPLGHAFTYSDPVPWLGHELGRIERRGLAALRAGRSYAAYVVGTSALGSQQGRNGHLHALRQVAALCLRVTYELRGAVQITLISDHGHDFQPGRWIALADGLRDLGFRIGTRRGPGIDAIVPAWGLVSCAAIYTDQPREIATAAVLLEGVEHCALRDPARPDVVLLLGRDGQAEIARTAEGLYAYRSVTGDPLGLSPPDDRIVTMRREDWLRATLADPWPAAVPRIWDAFDDRFVQAPEVLVSLGPGYYTGSRDLRGRMKMAATHGSLRTAGSIGFAMTTAGRLPSGLAIGDLPAALAGVNLTLPGQVAGETATVERGDRPLAEQVEDGR